MANAQASRADGSGDAYSPTIVFSRTVAVESASASGTAASAVVNGPFAFPVPTASATVTADDGSITILVPTDGCAATGTAYDATTTRHVVAEPAAAELLVEAWDGYLTDAVVVTPESADATVAVDDRETLVDELAPDARSIVAAYDVDISITLESPTEIAIATGQAFNVLVESGSNEFAQTIIAQTQCYSMDAVVVVGTAVVQAVADGSVDDVTVTSLVLTEVDVAEATGVVLTQIIIEESSTETSVPTAEGIGTAYPVGVAVTTTGSYLTGRQPGRYLSGRQPTRRVSTRVRNV